MFEMERTPNFNSAEAEAKFWRERCNMIRQEASVVTQRFDAQLDQLDQYAVTIEELTGELARARRLVEKERKTRRIAKRQVRRLQERLSQIERTNGFLSFSIDKYEQMQKSLERLGLAYEQEMDLNQVD